MAKAKKAVEDVIANEVVKVAETEVKKAPAKKTPAKKTAKPKEPTITAYIQYGGREVAISDIVNNIKENEGSDIKTLELYIKPEENAIYYIADGNVQGKKIDF